jgi:hypothetical protein
MFCGNGGPVGAGSRLVYGDGCLTSCLWEQGRLPHFWFVGMGTVDSFVVCGKGDGRLTLVCGNGDYCLICNSWDSLSYSFQYL